MSRTDYASTTELNVNAGGIMDDMADYQAFREENSRTTAAINETGFLNLDRDILVNYPDVITEGIVSGLVCYQ